MKKTFEKEIGITLISLVITIIVLLILSGITIKSLSGENGLIKRAVEARDKTEIATIKEQIELAKISSLDDNGEIIKQTLKIELGKINGIDKIVDKTNGVQVEYKGKTQFIQTENEKIELSEDELEDIADQIIQEQESQDYIIGIDVYGNQVDLVNWNSQILNETCNEIYIGPIENGTIIGEIPAYIIKSESGVVTKIPVVSLEGTFYNQTELKTINVAFPKTIIYYTGTFANSGITSIPPKLNIDKAENLYKMFFNCTGLTEIPQSFNLANASNLKYCLSMFEGCTELTTIPDGFAISPSVTDIFGMFQSTGITKIPKSLTLANLSKVTSCAGIFRYCTELTEIEEGFALPLSITNTGYMFEQAKITEIPTSLNLANLSNLKNCTSMFDGCSSLTKIPEGFALSVSTTDCSRMFRGTSINTLPTSFNLVNLNNLETCQAMFSESSITTLPSNFALPQNLKNCSGMFSLCESLQSVPDTFILGNNVEECQKLFEMCTSLTHVPSNFTIPPKVTTIEGMFLGVKSANFTNLIIPEGITNIIKAFGNVYELEGKITIEGNPTEYEGAFSYVAQNATQPLIVNYTSKCTNIEGIKATATEYAKIEFKLI